MKFLTRKINLNMAHYNSQSNSKMSKKSMYIKKTMDYSLPQNIIETLSKWVDCYNDTIMEKTKINMHLQFETRINDTDLLASSKKMSRSSKKSENERLKYEKEIFSWLSSMSDKDLDFYSDKICQYMKMEKDYMIKYYINPLRLENKQKAFDPNYKKDVKEVKDVVKTVVKKEPVEEKIEYKTDSNGKVLYGDAWDL